MDLGFQGFNEPSNYTSSTTWTTSSSHGDMSDMFLSNNDFVNSLELASECLQAKRLFQNGAVDNGKLHCHIVTRCRAHESQEPLDDQDKKPLYCEMLYDDYYCPKPQAISGLCPETIHRLSPKLKN